MKIVNSNKLKDYFINDNRINDDNYYINEEKVKIKIEDNMLKIYYGKNNWEELCLDEMVFICIGNNWDGILQITIILHEPIQDITSTLIITKN